MFSRNEKKKGKEEVPRPLVSIIIPVFNGENFVTDAILSALNQTYENIEVIVVNDGSTDNTSEIIKPYFPQIRYYEKDNGGVASALNYAISKARGKYISWLSHDDLYHPDKVKRQVETILNLPSTDWDRTIVWSNFDSMNAEAESLHQHKFEQKHPVDKLRHPIYPIVKGLVHGCSLLIPSSVLRDPDHAFDESLKLTQDYDLWFKIFPKNRLVFLPEPLVRSRIHPKQGSRLVGDRAFEMCSLWIGMITKMSDEDKIFCDGSIKSFHQSTYKILRHAKYKEATRHLEKLIVKDDGIAAKDIEISVVIPFHKANEWLIKAIESVQNQTHKSVEIILIDDSREDIPPMLRDSIETNPQIKMYPNQFKQGASGARNTGINCATGEYIAFLDSDDLFEPAKIETQLNFMLANNILACHTSYLRIGDASLIGDATYADAGSMSFVDAGELAENCVVATPTFMVQRALLGTSVRYRNDFKISEDVCFYLDILNRTEIRGLNEPLSTVRISQSTTAFDKNKQLLGLTNIIQHCIDEYLTNTKSALFRSKSLTTSLLELNTRQLSLSQTPATMTSVSDTEMKLKYGYEILQVGDNDLIGEQFNGHGLQLRLNALNIPTAHVVKNKQSDDENTFKLHDGSPSSENDSNAAKSIRNRLNLDGIFNPAFYELLFNPIFLTSKLVHFHLMHNGLVDMHLLPLLSKIKPLVWTFHDLWPIGGQCVHPFQCEKWLTHCYDCENLHQPFKSSNDNSALNDHIKRDAFERSDFKIIVASNWMKNIIERSPGFRNKDIRTIPFSFQNATSQEADKKAARMALGIPADDVVILFRCSYSGFKGMDYIEYFLTNYRSKVPLTIIHVDGIPKATLKNALSQFNVLAYPWVQDRELFERIAKAADIFLMPSEAESFGVMAVEAMLSDTLPIVIDGTALPEVVGAPECGVSTGPNKIEYFFAVKEFIENQSIREDRIRECKAFAIRKYVSRDYVSEVQSVYEVALSDHKLAPEDSLLLDQLKKRHSSLFECSVP